MKKLSRFFVTCLLVLAISAVTFAGETQTPGSPEQMPAPGEMQTPGATSVDPSVAETFDAVVEQIGLVTTWFLNSF